MKRAKGNGTTTRWMTGWVLWAATMTTGCVTRTPPPETPALPSSFEHSSQATDAAAAKAPPDASQPLISTYGSDELSRLLAAADRDSLDLAAASARLEQADARARIAGAALLPEVAVGGNATRYAGSANGTVGHETDWSALFSASFEVDFWGKNRAARDSAVDQRIAVAADLATVRLEVASAVAETYFRIASLRERIALALLNLDNARNVMAVAAARFDAGALGPVDVAQQRAIVATAEIVIPELEQQEAQTRAALAVLVGQPPEGFSVDVATLDGLIEPEITVGMPAELLQRRPDLRAAESSLQGAHADLNAARAALFPTLNLSLAGGLANPAIQAAVLTLTGTGPSLTAASDLSQTLFDHGKRRAAIADSSAKEHELLAQYRHALYNALSDVENALTARHSLDQQRDAQRANVEQSERALQGSQLRFREGSGQYLIVLEAQKQWYAAREQRVLYQLARLQATLDLSKALGGAWPISANVARN